MGNSIDTGNKDVHLQNSWLKVIHSAGNLKSEIPIHLAEAASASSVFRAGA